ncbi:hypothetical protein K504DRAFT_484308 [Pleomassaria siparia CBS 279.74]|uniref:WD40 repeat-like protein n=1 Tax=Pleomassaria siparia CBS 279.74 TaxID=1314801 RepID=A0A6G1K066_9PLEO|nr:hypothetical protein K504DRAFT_484308 [Pleomassaria siparia CBS 279.74]
MTSITPLHSLTLNLPPSCIEFWPLDPRYAVVGTYNLAKAEAGNDDAEVPDDSEGGKGKKTQQRNGSLILVQVDGDEVKVIQSLLTPSAILDIHFNHIPSCQNIFGVATSTGSIGIYTLVRSSPDNVPEILLDRTLQYFPEDILVTAFLWHPNGTSIGMSLSNGEICLRPFTSDETHNVPTSSIAKHDLEAWTLAFTPDGLGLYSGGDDSLLQFSELPRNHEHYFHDEADVEYGEVRKMPWSDRRIHGAGVTAILPLIANNEDSLVITGSYDDHIRLIHAPDVGRRSVLAEMNLGGGVWRLKMLKAETAPASGNMPEKMLLLASCMHAGAKIVSLQRGLSVEWEFRILAKFEEHKSMNYGSDSQPGVNDKGKRTFITTSFYDRLLCIWRA